MGLICLIGQLYIYALFARILLSWFPLQPDGVGAQLYSILYNVTEPVLGPARRAIPAVRVGGMGLDISVIIVTIGLQILLGILC